MSPPGSPSSVRSRWSGSVGLLLALLSLLGQLAIAAPHETGQLLAALALPAREASAETHGGVVATALRPASSVPAAESHDPARCPLCQASALARTSLNSAWIAEAPGPLAGATRLVVLEVENAAVAPVDAIAAPRAPPVRTRPA